MGRELHVGDKQRSNRQDRDAGVHDLRYETLDTFKQDAQYYKFLETYWNYWLEVNEEDLSGIEEFDVFGKIERVPQIEAYYCYKRNNGARVRLVYDEDDIVGFMLYYNIYNCIIAIDSMWAKKDYINRGLGKGMINSLHKPIKRVHFQTRKNNPPEDLFRATEGHRTLVHETPALLVWEMPWEVS